VNDATTIALRNIVVIGSINYEFIWFTSCMLEGLLCLLMSNKWFSISWH
jgi:hypothetical protein